MKTFLACAQRNSQKHLTILLDYNNTHPAMTPSEHNPQPELGAFERYARIIKLSDLELPPLRIYDHYHLAGEASKEFANLSIRENNAYALVIKDNNILGYLAWKELTVSQHDPTSQVKDFLFSFSQEQLLSPNTSIFDAFRLFQQHPSEVCFVTKDGQPNAILTTWLLYSGGMRYAFTPCSPVSRVPS